MAESKSSQVAPPSGDILDQRLLLKVLTSLLKGDFSARMPVDQTGLAGKISDILNEIIKTNARQVEELQRIGKVVGKEGKITQRASLAGAAGGWAAGIESVNTLITDLVQPTTEMSRVIGAVAQGDLRQRMALTIDGRKLTGALLQTAETVNTMVDQVNASASEIAREARSGS